jgi:hypothetical protein
MQIFLSYSSVDRELADQIHLALLGSGHSVFFDKESLPPAGDYQTKIRKAVADSDFLVFLISPESVKKGSFALTELGYARKKWKHPRGRVLPVMVRTVAYANIPTYLKAVTILEPEGNVAAEVTEAIPSDASMADGPAPPFKKAIDTDIALLQKQEPRQANFLEAVVEPVHAMYRTFKAEHKATFNEVREIVRDPSRSIEEAHGLVSEKERDERLSWMLFERLDELKTKSRAKHTEAYSNYVRALQACLMAVSGSDPRVDTIKFYSGLSDQLRHVVLEAARTPDVDIDVGSRARSLALKGIDVVLLEFQRYCTDVEMAYLQLRKDLLV